MPPGRVLITGAGGFTGRYLCSALEQRGYSVFGTTGAIDLLDPDGIGGLLAKQSFDYVVHLAAVSTIAHKRAGDYYRVNLLGTLNLLEALAERGKPRKIILASSANVYGRPARVPVEESATPAPLNHYAVSKLAMELMARLWFERLPILIVRPFNYSGLGQSASFVLPKIIGAFREGSSELELGDIAVTREFMDVRDVAQAYVRLLESEAAGEVVNLCAGRSVRLAEVLERLTALTGRAPALRRSEALVRGNEVPALVGSPEKLFRLVTGLTFRPLDDTLRWMLG